MSLLVRVPFQFLMCILFAGCSSSHGTEPEARAITNTLRGEVWGAIFTPPEMTTWLFWNRLQRKGWAGRRPGLDFMTGKQPVLWQESIFDLIFLMCFLYIFQIMHTLLKLGQTKSSAKQSLLIHLCSLSYANLNAQGRPVVVLKWSEHHDFVKWPQTHSFMENKVRPWTDTNLILESMKN